MEHLTSDSVLSPYSTETPAQVFHESGERLAYLFLNPMSAASDKGIQR